METIKIIDHIYWADKESFLLPFDTDSFWVAYLITKGSCEFKINTVTGITEGAALILCPPNTAFHRKVLEPLNFHFFRLDILPSAYFITQQSGEVLIHSPRLEMNEALLQQFVYDLSSFSFLMRSHLLLDLFLYQSASTQEDIKTFPENFSIRSTIIMEIVDYLENHSEKAISMQEIAARYNYNNAYFSRLFKQEVGVSPKEYLMKVRLKKVQQLLISSNLSIDAIAELTGFSHGDYLSKFFKKNFKLPPNEFRKKHRI